MNEHDKAHAGEMSLAEFNELVRERAIRDGRCVPETEEELDILEEDLKDQHAQIPEFSDVMRLVQEKPGGEERTSVKPDIDDQVLDELALAARNGGEIPKDVRKKMLADRREQQGKKDR